ncbi:hypothetical protein NGM37_17985, partial [Streptomyces sp. TRM76130]|nr:hypothetical protein [Streptomyces sp. TRM76130]
MTDTARRGHGAVALRASCRQLLVAAAPHNRRTVHRQPGPAARSHPPGTRPRDSAPARTAATPRESTPTRHPPGTRPAPRPGTLAR